MFCIMTVFSLLFNSNIAEINLTISTLGFLLPKLDHYSIKVSDMRTTTNTVVGYHRHIISIGALTACSYGVSSDTHHQYSAVY